MIFTTPSWAPDLPFDPPDSTTLGDFWADERYGRCPIEKSRNPFTCGVTGKTYTTLQMKERSELLARSLAQRLHWQPNTDTPWDKIVCVFSFNSIDYLTSNFAVHRFGGIVTLANAQYSASELEFQLRTSGSKAIITCTPLLETALKAALAVGIAEDKVYIIDTALEQKKARFKTLDELIHEGRALPDLEPLRWVKGQGARQVAYLCYSSGTSGLPKGVMIPHRSIIANMMQIRWFDSVHRKDWDVNLQTVLGLLPLSHVYGLVVVALAGIYSGDSVILLPKFDLKNLLQSIQRFKINELFLVPPIIIQLLSNPQLSKSYDLSSVRMIYTGAAPLGDETQQDVRKLFPDWTIGQGYGMTETATLVLSSSELDIVSGSAGSLLPRVRAKIIGEDGKVISEYGPRGELYIQSPSLTLGYFNNERATSEAFVFDEDGRWMRTGDVAIAVKSPAGHDHFSIVDRVKELIKVKGHQVAPAELEAHLLSHPAVDDCAVIPVPHEASGEVPKAYVVKAPSFNSKPEDEVVREICKHVEDHKSRYKWLKGGVTFIDSIPKTPSGKILRRFLRDKEKEAKRNAGAKM